MSFVVELPLAQYHGDAFGGFANAADFTIGTARAAAWLARLAYESDAGKIDTILAGWDLRPRASIASAVTLLPTARTRGLVVDGHDAIFLVFAGTDPLVVANWVTDFNARISPEGLHGGFGAALASVWPQVAQALSGADDRPLFILGHSLGGALAVLAADRVARELGRAPRAVYTFGMPRAGGAEFAGRYALHAVTYRLLHGDDIVPSVPPSELGFRHVGRLMRAPRGGVFDDAGLSPPGSDEPPFAASLIAGLATALPDIGRGWPQPPARTDALGFAARFLPPRIGDHLPDRYCGAFNRPA
jgi:hypothetical protein